MLIQGYRFRQPAKSQIPSSKSQTNSNFKDSKIQKECRLHRRNGTPRCGVREWPFNVAYRCADGAARRPYHGSATSLSGEVTAWLLIFNELQNTSLAAAQTARDLTIAQSLPRCIERDHRKRRPHLLVGVACGCEVPRPLRGSG